MKRRKLLAVMCALISGLCLTSCNMGFNESKNSTSIEQENEEIMKVYTQYVATTQKQGSNPMSYEDWLRTIKGEKGDTGVGIKEIKIDGAGNWTVFYTDGTSQKLNISSEENHIHSFGAWYEIDSVEELEDDEMMGFQVCSECGEIRWSIEKRAEKPEVEDPEISHPDFTVKTMAAENGVFGFDGNEYNLSENNGKVRVINFWATWCSACKQELPYFDQFAKAYPEVEVIAICGESGPKDVVTEWLNEPKMEAQTNGWANFSLVFGFYGSDDENVYQAFGGTGMLPMTVVVDEEGNIRYQKEASLNFETLEEIVKPLLSD